MPETQTAPRRTFDRSIVEGPLGPAVWRLAWPTMLQNVIAGLQGIIDHAMVGQFVGYTGNAAIGVSWQIILVVIVFISSLFTGMAILVARFVGHYKSPLDGQKENNSCSFRPSGGEEVGVSSVVGSSASPANSTSTIAEWTGLDHPFPPIAVILSNLRHRCRSKVAAVRVERTCFCP